MANFSIIKDIFSHTPHIKLAVVGPSASGKSYLITDMIQAFNNMGMLRHSLPGYRDFGLYDSDVTTDDRQNPRPKTDKYACRAENHYGAEFTHEGKDFKLDFLNIPGEIFNPNSEDLKLFFVIRQRLIENCKKRFMIVTWTDGFNDELYVEPRGVSAETQHAIDEAKRAGATKATRKGREMQYSTWEQIYAEINHNGRNLKTKGKPEIIDGKYLLEHIREFNVDSAMRSIAEVIATLGIGLDTYDFMEQAISFYFFNYCYTATDMVVCDKMILPNSNAPHSDSASPTRENEIEFVPLVTQLVTFFAQKKNHHPHIYLAYRGADFFFKNKESNWRVIMGLDAVRSLTDQKRRNAIYAIASLLLHNHRFNMGAACSDDDFNSFVGLDVENWGNGERPVLEFLSEKLMDFVPQDGTVMTGGDIKDLFQSHQGQNMKSLMLQSYKTDCVVEPGAPLAGMMRHVYYTATPISDNFYVFRNDPACNNQCFYRDDFEGHLRFFHNYNSHLCFGTYQLCLDILQQNSVVTRIEGGDLYANLT